MASKHKKRNHRNSPTTTVDDDDVTIPVVFRYPGRVSTLHRSVKINDNMSLSELLSKVRLNSNDKVPDAQDLFGLFYIDEIRPFINAHGQQTTKTKKEIAKLWQFQSSKFHSIYKKRADLLRSSSAVSAGDNAIFTYYSCHGSAKQRNHIFIKRQSAEELIVKLPLKATEKPPAPYKVFETYFFSEIVPFLKQSGKQSIVKGKKDLFKLWQIQNKSFKDIYEERARILCNEWRKLNNNECEAVVPLHLIRTLLNFLLFVECTQKTHCFMLLIDDQKEKEMKYKELYQYLRRDNGKHIVYVHIRVYINNLDVNALKVNSGKGWIKLCFVHKEEELLLFAIKFNDLIDGLEDKIDQQNIEFHCDEITRILSINVPFL